MTTDRAFLNVTQSLTGRRWVGPGLEADRQAEAMAQITRLPMAPAPRIATRCSAPTAEVRRLSVCCSTMAMVSIEASSSRVSETYRRRATALKLA